MRDGESERASEGRGWFEREWKEREGWTGGARRREA